MTGLNGRLSATKKTMSRIFTMVSRPRSTPTTTATVGLARPGSASRRPATSRPSSGIRTNAQGVNRLISFGATRANHTSRNARTVAAQAAPVRTRRHTALYRRVVPEHVFDPTWFNRGSRADAHAFARRRVAHPASLGRVLTSICFWGFNQALKQVRDVTWVIRRRFRRLRAPFPSQAVVERVGVHRGTSRSARGSLRARGTDCGGGWRAGGAPARLRPLALPGPFAARRDPGQPADGEHDAGREDRPDDTGRAQRREQRRHHQLRARLAAVRRRLRTVAEHRDLLGGHVRRLPERGAVQPPGHPD